jgi:hypothetical protein
MTEKEIEKPNLNELYEDQIKEEDIKSKTKQPYIPKRKSETLKILHAPSKRSKKVESDSDDDEENKKKEEAQKREYILKIENACQPDLLGKSEEVTKLRKELKLQTMSLKELKKTWQRILAINGCDHPRHFIYDMTLGVAKKAELILNQYPQWSAPGFSNRLQQNQTFRQKMHIWALDKFPHTEISTEMSMIYNIFQEYQQARAVGAVREEKQKVWNETKVADEIVAKFSDL